MGRGFLMKIARAAVAQPWDYYGTGAPDEWEFRVSPGEDQVAVWSPAVGEWVLFQNVVDQEHLTQEQGERRLDDWARYVEELDDDND